MTFAIEKNIPMAQLASCSRKFYPFAEMEIGDSFFVPASAEYTTRQLVSRMGSSTRHAAKKHSPKKWACRKQADGVRVWRIA